MPKNTTVRSFLLADEDEIAKLKREIHEHVKKEKVHLKEIKTLTNLNRELQNTVINKFKELTLITGQDEQAPPMIITDPPVGYRIDGNIHLGRGEYIPVQIYDSICFNAAKSKMKWPIFVKELAVSVFGRLTLMTSSVTGSQCNRTKAPAKRKLDSTKLMAICDILQYRMEEVGDSPDLNINNVNKWVAEKIQDMVRPLKIKKLPAVSVKTTENDEEGDDN